MSELISESIVPVKGTGDTLAMARGEPGLPIGFHWRDVRYDVVEKLDMWKQSSREGGRATADLYLRRIYYKLRMSDDSTWTIFCLRQSPRSGDRKRMWYLYTIDQ